LIKKRFLVIIMGEKVYYAIVDEKNNIIEYSDDYDCYIPALFVRENDAVECLGYMIETAEEEGDSKCIDYIKRCRVVKVEISYKIVE